MTTMKAAVLYGKEDVRIENVPVPKVGPGEIQVKIGAATTCGTDVKVYRRGYHARMISPPVPFGHEFAGTVSILGDGVTKFKVGDRVVVSNSAPCDTCYFCKIGRFELCEDLLFLNGAYAEFITVPDRIVQKNTWSLFPDTPFEIASLSEPLACVLRGIHDTLLEPEQTVAVLGVGPIGLMFVMMLKMAGHKVIAIGRSEGRLSIAKQLGADHIVSTLKVDDIITTVKQLSNDGFGPDVVFECVGLPETWQIAIDLVRKAGTVNLFGGCPKETSITLDTSRVHYDELRILGTFHHTPEIFEQAVTLINSKKLPMDLFLQNRISLDGVPDIIRNLAQSGGAIKTAVIME